MRRSPLKNLLAIVCCAVSYCLLPALAYAAKTHCLSLYDPCKYPENFTHFAYVNPDAPKGGEVKLADTGSFDSLNPFILKGVKAPGISSLFAALMTQSQDEAQSMYGLIAESAEISADKSSIVFTLRKEAVFHDGSVINADDVVFSYQTLKEKGDPTYRILFTPVIAAEKISAQQVRFTIDKNVREAALIAASLPIISKAYYTKVEFDKTTLEAPLGSGPYMVEKLDAGRSITYRRIKNHWMEKIPATRGINNFDSINYDMYRDENVALEAFKSGAYDFRREYVARNWAKAYDHPAIASGKIIKREVADKTPQGMQAFLFNTRRENLADKRVREAIALAMDFEWLNKTIFYNAYKRNSSFFGNTEFAAPDAISPPVTDGSGNPRANLLKAQELLNDAGWMVKDGKRANAQGKLLSIEFLLQQPTMERVIGPLRKNLERIGIASSIRMVDSSQYQKRIDDKDFDIISIWINRGLFYPGNEQMAFWHSSQADVKGGNNLAGSKNPQIDKILEKLINAKNKEELVSAGQALDRTLLAEHYVIPNWQSASYRIAYWNKFAMPKQPPKYSLGFETWWISEKTK